MVAGRAHGGQSADLEPAPWSPPPARRGSELFPPLLPQPQVQRSLSSAERGELFLEIRGAEGVARACALGHGAREPPGHPLVQEAETELTLLQDERSLALGLAKSRFLRPRELAAASVHFPLSVRRQFCSGRFQDVSLSLVFRSLSHVVTRIL